MIFEHSSYRSYLKAILAERIAGNPSYSLRALARDLKIHPSQLSAIFKGRKGLSQESAYRVARKLDLSNEEAEYLSLLVQLEAAPSEELKDVALSKMRALNRKGEIKELSVDLFKVISDWYHFPVLEMTELRNFKYTPKNIAARLGITALEAEAAIERLERLELIEKSNGRYRKSQNNLVVESKNVQRAIQNFHKQMLQKAIECFDTTSPSERYIGTHTFAFDPKQFDQARAIVDRVRHELAALTDQKETPTEVYQFGIQFFRLTKKENSNETR